MNLASFMKAHYVGVRDFKIHLSHMLDQNKPLVVTERGKPRHFVIPYDEMIEIIEILEEASDPKLVSQVERARSAYKKGKEVPLDLSRLRKELGLYRS